MKWIISPIRKRVYGRGLKVSSKGRRLKAKD
jgi:hypothetical protein